MIYSLDIVGVIYTPVYFYSSPCWLPDVPFHDVVNIRENSHLHWNPANLYKIEVKFDTIFQTFFFFKIDRIELDVKANRAL